MRLSWSWQWISPSWHYQSSLQSTRLSLHGSTATLIMFWQILWSITWQMHGKLSSVCSLDSNYTLSVDAYSLVLASWRKAPHSSSSWQNWQWKKCHWKPHSWRACLWRKQRCAVSDRGMQVWNQVRREGDHSHRHTRCHRHIRCSEDEGRARMACVI